MDNLRVPEQPSDVQEQSYEDFLRAKIVTSRDCGIDIDESEINPLLKPPMPTRIGLEAEAGAARLVGVDTLTLEVTNVGLEVNLVDREGAAVLDFARTGLARNTTYYFRVQAVNGANTVNGAASTVLTLPSATATASNGANGAPITGG